MTTEGVSAVRDVGSLSRFGVTKDGGLRCLACSFAGNPDEVAVPSGYTGMLAWLVRIADEHNRVVHLDPLRKASVQGDARFDLRLRSLDREPGEPLYACTYSSCGDTADWSVWLKTPDDSPTYTLCERHALAAVAGTTVRLTP